MNDGYKAYCGGMTPPLPDMLFHDVVEASQRDKTEVQRERRHRPTAHIMNDFS